jgi:predicted lipoprotein with Yx(FWY)xxD motif
MLAAFAAAVVLAAPAPAIRYVDDQFGPVLATPGKRALYTWTAEKDLKIHCLGQCAKVWPPLYAKGRMPAKIAGIRGTFGVIRRPDGRLQVTFNRRPVYTYLHERPTQVLCDDVNGWFVVRLR